MFALVLCSVFLLVFGFYCLCLFDVHGSFCVATFHLLSLESVSDFCSKLEEIQWLLKIMSVSALTETTSSTKWSGYGSVTLGYRRVELIMYDI